MIITILIVLFSLILLTGLHELGHFLFAKRFGIKVEEFGICYPPRIYGKKIKGTIYSLNLLPFGAFVKIKGEDGAPASAEASAGKGRENDSFACKPIWQRAVVLVAGVVMFWLVAFLIFTFVSGIFGVPTSITDEMDSTNATVQVMAVSDGSPAALAGIKSGDEFVKIEEAIINKTIQVQEIAQENLGKEITLTLKRNNKEIEVALTPRANPPQGEGAMGIALVRVENMKTVWYKAPWQGIVLTARLTKAIPVNLYQAIKLKITGQKVVGVQFMGPIGFGQMLGQSLESGLGNFMVLMGMISIWLAIFNLFPIPALDGGRLLFLGIEAIRRKPINQKIEQKITAFFFFGLILMMIVLSVRDLFRIF